MNERDELAELKREQARLEKELGYVSLRLSRLERRIEAPVLKEETEPKQAELPPILPVQEQLSSAALSSNSPAVGIPSLSATTPPVLANIKPEPVLFQARATEPAASSAMQTPMAAISSGEPESKPPKRSLELQLGTYWAPRIGIVVLLTGLVFLGNLAYQKLGATGKVLLLYGASALLLGAGAWWQRHGKDALKNYAQVLFAGGLASLYFTTYAAHHLESLRVIQSPALDGILLLGCAGFMVWTADQWRSEILAMFGTGLAYYTCVMTRVGYFTLYSNLVLTVVAVFFLVRNRWLALSFGSLAATYAAYAFWRFFSGEHWHWASPSEGLWSGTYFLASYWVVFTAGVFLSREEKFAGPNRAAFLTLNNGAFFTLFILTMLQVNTGGFWKFCLIYGTVLIALAEAANRILPEEEEAKNFYLTQGLLLGTIGLISKFAGLQLALILAAESVLLLMMAYQRLNSVLLIGSYLVAGLSIGWGMDGMRQEDPAGIYLAIGLGVLMMADALLVQHFIKSSAAKENSRASRPFWVVMAGTEPVERSSRLRPQVGYFTVLALTVWFVATWNNTSPQNFPLILTAEALALSFSIYLLRAREITVLSQLYVLLAILAWISRWALTANQPPWWNPLVLIVMILALSHWWQKQTVIAVAQEKGLVPQFLYALGVVGILHFWISRLVPGPQWLALSIGLALVLTAYGVATRAWMLAACGQIFVLIGVLQFIAQLLSGKPNGWFALAPVAGIGLLSWSTSEWFRLRPDASARVRDPLLQVARIYRWVALPMCIGWIFEYVPERGIMSVSSLMGLGIFLFAGFKKSKEALLYGAVFSAVTLLYFWPKASESKTLYWANFLAILVIPVQQQIMKRRPAGYPVDPRTEAGVIFAGGLSIWWFCTQWVLEQSSGFFLTASWSLLALVFFTCGIVLRERVYRWLGLGLIALSLGRIVIVDVWRLEMLYRILSFMALGLVLLVLGFVYSKYQEKIRQWL